MTVNPKLTQGPQNAVPKIIAIAKSGKNALPKTIPVLDKKPSDTPPKARRFMTRLYWMLVRNAVLNYTVLKKAPD